MKNKASIAIAILLLAIGFAAISTTLIINGNIKVGENTDDFSVIFTKATLDGTDVYANVIDDTKKILNFSTNDLKTLNQTSVLNYEVMNASNIYDAKIQVNCKVKDDAEAKYTSIKNALENDATVVKAKETLKGSLIITLNQASIEEIKEEYVCTLEFNAVEKDEFGVYNGPTEWIFDYTGGEQTFVAPISGIYKIETWGAQGGTYNSEFLGGYGGYSVGMTSLPFSSIIYISVGGAGSSGIANEGIDYEDGGYNGGGNRGSYNCPSCNFGSSSGGGATHVALTSGLLSTLENKKSDILIVSGGGGGSGYVASGWNQNSTNIPSGGGYIGNIGQSDSIRGGISGTQSTGYAFGLGQGCKQKGVCDGGGGGFYGGSLGRNGAGGGSGYIGNTLLTEKAMYCYNCQESTEESTKTISTKCVSSTPTENCAKQGNGYAKITLIK